MKTVKERLLKFIESLPYGQQKFEISTGLSNGWVNKMNENGITLKSQNKIAAAYPALNMEWLLHGLGDMLRDDSALNKASTIQNAINTILFDEIASLKANLKGTLTSDERDMLMSRVQKLNSDS